MSDNKLKTAVNDIRALSGVNLYSTMNPVLWCGMTAFELERCYPGWFRRPASFVLLVAVCLEIGRAHV